jgi:cell division protein FtsZ
MAKEKQKIQKKELKEKEIEEIKKIKIKVVGIGGGGGNIVSEIAQIKNPKISFSIADTDAKSLKRFPKNIEHFVFGEKIAQGLGTGMDVNLGIETAKSSREKIKNILSGYDLIIFIATLGGGVGSGASQVFAQVAKNLGILTYGIFTLPFNFEGKRKMEIAKTAIFELRRKLHAISILSNEKIFEVAEKSLPLDKALSLMNKILAFNLKNLIQVIFQPGLINIDFADLKTIFDGQGLLTYLNSAQIKEEITKEIEKILSSPFYPYSIEGAKGVLLNIKGPKDLSLETVSKISKTISERVNKDAKIIFGISSQKEKAPTVLVLATGCTNFPFENFAPEKKVENKRKKKKIKIKEEKKEVEKKEVKERKNGIQLQKEIEKQEAEFLAKEKAFEPPTFLRKKLA